MRNNKEIEFRKIGYLIRARYNTWNSIKKYDNELSKKISNAVIMELRYLLKFYEDNK